MECSIRLYKLLEKSSILAHTRLTNHNADQYHKRHDGLQRVAEVIHLSRFAPIRQFSIGLDLQRVGEFRRCQSANEYSSDSHRPKVTCEHAFAERVDVGDKLVEGEHDRQAPEQNDKKAQYDKTPGGDREFRSGEVIKGNPSTNKDKARAIEQ